VNHDLDRLQEYLCANVRLLRLARGLTQEGLAELAGVPRATIAKIEAGSPNPTLATTARLAAALRVSLDELVAPPASSGRLYPADSLPRRSKGGVELRQLLPHPLPGLTLERLSFAPQARLGGAPHLPGSREYLVCESGRVQLTTPAERWELGPGDVVAYRGDQPHGYTNPSEEPSVAFTIIEGP
jgi:transcriptional regulator with XRE-family HTH domain